MKKSLGKSDAIYADMAELADAHGSGPCRSNSVEVRILLSAPFENANIDTISVDISVFYLCPIVM